MPFISRKTSLSRLRERIRKNQPIVGAGAGTGISAKFAERGGVDLIIIYNSGRYRMAGRGSLAGLLPYGDANAIVQDMAKEVLPVVRDTPVLAGVCGTDPFRIIPVLLRELKAMGFDGIQNFPTVGLIDGVFRANLEETGMSYDLEVEMVREARRLDLLTCPYVFDGDSAKAMAKAGADVLVAHLGLTTKGSIGAKTALTLDESAARVQAMHDAARAVRPDIIVLCHGGPIAEPEDAEYVLAHTSGHRRVLRRLEHRAARHRERHRGPGPPVPRHEDASPRHDAGERSEAMTTTAASVIRRVLLAAALAAVAIVVVPAQQRPAATPPPEARPLRLLFLGHDRDHHPSGKLLPLIAAPLARRGIQMTHVSTPEEALVASTLKHYDGLVLYANHETITPEQEQALVDFVEGGKAIVAIHCASFMFTKAPRYIPMVGGQFQRHGTGEFTAEIIAPDHPVMKGLKPFTTWDETYVHTRHNPVDRTVLMERVDKRRPRAVHVGADAGQGPRLLHRVSATTSGPGAIPASCS